MSELAESQEAMESYRQEKAGNCLSEAREAAGLINDKLSEYNRAVPAFNDAYMTLNNVDENDPDYLVAANVVSSFVIGAETNGQRIIKDFSKDDRILKVEPHVSGMRNAARQEPLEYYRGALRAAKTQYQLMREGKEGGHEDLLIGRIARLNAAVVELENKNQK